MDEAEVRRLAAERWPLTEYNRREFAVLYERYEYLQTALQTVLTLLDETRHNDGIRGVGVAPLGGNDG